MVDITRPGDRQIGRSGGRQIGKSAGGSLSRAPVFPRSRLRFSGFTLIEVLVALAIVSIALLAALRAAGLGTTGAGELRSRLLAGWVAENLLAEHSARGDWLPLGIQRGTGHQGGIEFAWREEVTALPNPAFRRVDVFVYETPDDSRSLARLTGFIVQPPGGAR